MLQRIKTKWNVCRKVTGIRTFFLLYKASVLFPSTCTCTDVDVEDSRTGSHIWSDRIHEVGGRLSFCGFAFRQRRFPYRILRLFFRLRSDKARSLSTKKRLRAVILTLCVRVPRSLQHFSRSETGCAEATGYLYRKLLCHDASASPRSCLAARKKCCDL